MTSAPPTILFVCLGNACRSQMAEGFARHMGGPSVQALSCGSHPAGFVASQAVAAMREKGIDISHYVSKGIAELPRQNFDYVVTMGCDIACPVVPGTKQIEWNIPDPIGRSDDFFREVRDQIEGKVKALLEETRSKGF